MVIKLYFTNDLIYDKICFYLNYKLTTKFTIDSYYYCNTNIQTK